MFYNYLLLRRLFRLADAVIQTPDKEVSLRASNKKSVTTNPGGDSKSRV